MNEDDNDEYVACPTLSQACKWLRGMDVLVAPLLTLYSKYKCQVWKVSEYEILYTTRRDFNFTYEEAVSEGIDKALEMLENKEI